MDIKIPKGLERLEPHFKRYTLKDAYNFTFKGINVPFDYRRETPNFAAIALFNGEDRLYELLVRSMHKHFGKYGAAAIMRVAMDNDMGLELVEEMWNDRNVQISHNVLSAMENCDEKYIRLLVNTDKFIRKAKKEFTDSTVLAWIKQYAPRLITIGYENPKMAKILMKVYTDTNDDFFLSSEAKEMFIF